jgi:hypothetical protein
MPKNFSGHGIESVEYCMYSTFHMAIFSAGDYSKSKLIGVCVIE